MAVEEVIKDEYSDENFLPGDNSKAAALGEDENVQVGDAFENTKADSFEVRYYQNKRLAGEATNLKKENEQLKLDNEKYKIDLSEKIFDSCLCIPSSSNLNKSKLKIICETIKEIAIIG